jgi:hypothetical protein
MQALSWVEILLTLTSGQFIMIANTFWGIRICRIVRIKLLILIRGIREIRILKTKAKPMLITFHLFPLILACLFIVQEAKDYQIAENNVIVSFDEKRGEPEARGVIAIVVEARQELMEKYHLPLSAPVEIRLSPTTAEFCQRTGRPWWLSSIYQNRTIYLQPVRVLRERGILAATLRHELMHQLVDEHTKGKAPIWLFEALAVYYSGEITLLKVPRKTNKAGDLTWRGLERRLQTAASKEEFERLYFQLYHLGRFLETKFQVRQITALLLRLGEKKNFEQACLEAFGSSAEEIEPSWQRHWAKEVK